MTLDLIEKYLRSVSDRPASPTPQALSEALRVLKVTAVNGGDESEAKKLWCLEEALQAQNLYLEAFQLMKQKKFYEAWCALERAEMTLESLECHETSSSWTA